MLITLLSFLVVIGVLVFVHELGHLVAAKSVGISCPRFSIGFGPRIAGFTWGETEYVISLLPLGGYVRMAGMEDTAALEGGVDPDHQPSDRDFDSKPLLARIWVVTAGVIMNFLFAIVVIAAVGLIWGEAINPSTRVAISQSPPLSPTTAPLATVPVGATIASIGNQSVGNWNDVRTALASAPAGRTTITFSDASPVTIDLPASDSARVAAIEPFESFTAPIIREVSPGTPAEAGGLEAGDRILSIDGTPIAAWTQFVDIVQASAERALAIEVMRDDQRIRLTVTPEAQRDETSPDRVEIGWLGVAAQVDVERRPMGVGESFQRGVEVTWSTSTAIVDLLGKLFTGEASPRSLGGPLTIGQISGQTARAGMETLLQWMALLSVNLAVLNLLPIPVLDGGQLLFLLIEGLRGKPLSVEQRLRFSHVGLIIVVGIMVWAIANDFLRLFGI